jgi:PAS domain S-box-containing protein
MRSSTVMPHADPDQRRTTETVPSPLPTHGGSEFQAFLLRLGEVAREVGDARNLADRFCSLCAAYFGVSTAQLWRIEDGWLTSSGATGRGDQIQSPRFRLQDASLVEQALRQQRTLFVNHRNPAETVDAQFAGHSLLAAPVVLFGEAPGVLTLLHASETGRFDDDVAARATVVATHLGSLLEIQRLRESSQARGVEADSYRARAENLMDLALVTSSSIGLPEFVTNFLARALSMMEASAGALVLAQREVLETIALHDPALPEPQLHWRALNAQLTKLLQEQRAESVVSGPGPELLGDLLAKQLGWRDVMVVKLTGIDRELLGVFVLANRGRIMTAGDQSLLNALVAHACVALENSRLFSQIVQASHHWQDIFDAIPDLIVVHDSANRVLRVNRSWAEKMGQRPQELIGLGMGALLISSPTQQALRFAGPHACPFCPSEYEPVNEYVHPVFDRTYLVSTSGVHGVVGEGRQTVHVLKDITERREAEQRYRELFDNIQEGLFFSDPDGRFIEVNSALVRMLGYDSREELLAVDIPSMLYLFPEQRRRFTAQIEGTGQLQNFEETLRRKDGSLIHTLQNAFAVRDAYGATVQYRGLILDITEQKTVQSQLQRERDFNTKILDTTQSMILVADTAGLVSYANRRCFDVGGVTETQLIGHRLSEIVAIGRRKSFADVFESTVMGDVSENIELPMVRGSGKTGTFSVSLSPMRDEHANVTSVVVVMTDITEAAELQAKLINTEKMAAIGQLVSGVAHEVNNPLTAILGFADLLLDTPGLPPDASRDLNVIIQEAQRTKRIVQNLLSFARQAPRQRKPVQLNNVLHRTVQLRAYDFSSHGVEVTEDYQDLLPEVLGDAQQLQQVFLNILNNAYDAVRGHSGPRRIQVGTMVAEGLAEVSFRDSGPGISDVDRIFDPFFTTKELGQGTGLGLSICYGIVREHGGEITARNNTDGPGATFVVRLPMAGAAGETSGQAGRNV